MDELQHVERSEGCRLDVVSQGTTPDARSRPPRIDISSPGANARRLRDAHHNGDGALFASHRARLFRIAHRMLGARADAEDVVQDVYLRWRHSTARDVASPIAFLITITRRLCLDRLREIKRQAEFADPLRPASVVEDQVPSPEVQIEFSELVSAGFLAVLERLAPAERTAFLLHEVFDCDYHEVGSIIGSTESACRQMIHRARAHLRNDRARFAVTSECHERFLKKFVSAMATGDREALMALVEQDAEVQPRNCRRRRS